MKKSTRSRGAAAGTAVAVPASSAATSVTRTRGVRTRTKHLSQHHTTDSIPSTDNNIKDITNKDSIDPNKGNSISAITMPIRSSTPTYTKVRPPGLKDTPLTTRGSRSVRRTLAQTHEPRTGKQGDSIADLVVSEEEMEEPRRHHVEAVVIVERAQKARLAMKDWSHLEAPSHLEASSLESNMHKATSADSTSTIATGITSAHASTGTITTQAQSARSALQDGFSDPHTDHTLSRTSVSPPPPPLFDMEDDIEGFGSPWLMVFDSASSSYSRPSLRPRRLQPDLTLADLEMELDGKAKDDLEPPGSPCSATSFSRRLSARKSQGHTIRDLRLGELAEVETGEGEVEMEMEIEAENEEEDDPFGFTEVERQLQRTKTLRPKLVAINELAHFDNISISDSANSSTNSNRNIGVSNNTEHRETINSLDRSVMERMATRKRGDVKGKGKAVDRGNLTLDTKSQSSEIMDADINKAIQLSLGIPVDTESGEGPSTRPILPLSSQVAIDYQDDADTNRSNRRTSRVYGRTDSAKNQPSPVAGDSGLPTSAIEIQDENLETERPGALPSTPPNTTPIRTQNHRLSLESCDGLSPIVFESTPTKIPEAGMPITPESPSTKTVKGRSKAKKYMPSEQLEALLPRRKKRRPVETNKRRRQPSRRAIDASDADSEVESITIFSASSEDEEEEEETLVRRRRPTGTQDTTSTGGAKRRAPIGAPQGRPSKRTQHSLAFKPAAVSSKKGKEAEVDRSGWTAEQWAAHEKCIKYFEQVDAFKLEEETAL
ncbi:hypothetical protein BG011_003779 [Mortierella polycephala]|uniref:Uncharacterized protein n=1 Tax=Mortierella polycephala TaxID=41804 RepID=A0A9P6Q2U8_9FUNG|nr:hypothetical protein BG011_003779 [Mortierella polycephala]